jgi:hypothetical protein
VVSGTIESWPKAGGAGSGCQKLGMAGVVGRAGLAVVVERGQIRTGARGLQGI